MGRWDPLKDKALEPYVRKATDQCPIPTVSIDKHLSFFSAVRLSRYLRALTLHALPPKGDFVCCTGIRRVVGCTSGGEKIFDLPPSRKERPHPTVRKTMKMVQGSFCQESLDALVPSLL